MRAAFLLARERKIVGKTMRFGKLKWSGKAKEET